jgi:hypothetical protein
MFDVKDVSTGILVAHIQPIHFGVDVFLHREGSDSHLHQLDVFAFGFDPFERVRINHY